jgi:hypothetical protein
MEKYFWFLGIIMGPIFGTLVWLEFRAVVEQHHELQPARRFLSVSTGLLLSVPYFLIGGCQLLGGFSNPGFVLTPDVDNPWIALALGVVVLTHVIAFFILRNQQVAELISRLSYVNRSPSTVRLVSQLVVVVSLAVNLLAAYFGAGAR